MPSTSGKDDGYINSIPAGFGEPVRLVYADCWRFLDLVPGWIVVDENTVHLPSDNLEEF